VLLVCRYDKFSSYMYARNTSTGVTLTRQSKLYMRPPIKQLPHIVIVTVDSLRCFDGVYFIFNCKHFNLLNLVSFILLMIFCNQHNRSTRLSDVDGIALKHVGVLSYIKYCWYIYIYICVCVCVFVVYLLVWIVNCTRCVYIKILFTKVKINQQISWYSLHF
jgi:hypothetical protein